MTIGEDESEDVKKHYPNLDQYYGELSVSKDLYLLTFLSSDDISRIEKLEVTQEKDYEGLAIAYREILLSHMENLEPARKSVGICSSTAIEKEIFKMFNKCMKFIESQRRIVENQPDRYKKRLIINYQLMSVSFFEPLDDNPPFTLNCFCRVVESNLIVYFCLSDNPIHAITHRDRARRACEFANVTAVSLPGEESASYAASHYMDAFSEPSLKVSHILRQKH